MLSDPCVRVRETTKITVPMMTEPTVVHDRLIDNPIAAPELIARVRASLRAMKITTMQRSRLDAH